jgi:hypothetical protein
MNTDKASGIFHVSLERLGMHFGLIDMGRLNAIGQDKAYGRAIKDRLDGAGVFAKTAQGPEKSALGRFPCRGAKVICQVRVNGIYAGTVGNSSIARAVVPMCL